MMATVRSKPHDRAESPIREVGAVLDRSVPGEGFVLCVSEGCEAAKVGTKFVRANFK